VLIELGRGGRVLCIVMSGNAAVIPKLWRNLHNLIGCLTELDYVADVQTPQS